MLLSIIKQGQMKGEIRKDVEAAHFATIIMGTLRNFVNMWHLSNHAFNLMDEGNELLKSIRRLISTNN